MLLDDAVRARRRRCAGLADLRARAEADELMITTQTHNPADRRRSFQLVAEAVRG
jgi:hypothetical protein